MDLRDVQGRVDAWIRRSGGGYWHPLAQLARLTEELGELAREINDRHGEKPKKRAEAPGDVALELGDMLFVIACLANSLEIDLEEAFGRALAKYEARDAGRWAPGAGGGNSA